MEKQLNASQSSNLTPQMGKKSQIGTTHSHHEQASTPLSGMMIIKYKN